MSTKSESARIIGVFKALQTFAIWGFEAPMAYIFISKFGNPVFLLIVSYLFSSFYLWGQNQFLKDKDVELENNKPLEKGYWKCFSSLDNKKKILLFIAGSLRFLKDFCYYYVIYLYPEKIVHIIGLNYLWPISFFLYESLKKYILKEDLGHKSFNKSNLSVFVVSIFGAFFISSNTNLSFTKDITFYFLTLGSILFGSGHSFIYSLYNDSKKREGEEIAITTAPNFTLFIRSCIAFVLSVCSIIFCYESSIDLNSSLVYLIGFGILFSFVQIILAHGLYTEAMKKGDHDDFNAFTIYSMFIGIYSSIIFFKAPYTSNVILGILVISYSVFFIRNKKSYLNALDKSLISLLIFLFAYFHFFSNLSQIHFNANLEVVSGMFSIIIGFSLSRLLDKAKRENELLTITGMLLSKILRYLEACGEEDLLISVKEDSNEILRGITRFNFFPDGWDIKRGKDIIAKVDNLEEKLIKAIKHNDSIDKVVVIDYLNEFETHVELWINERSRRLPRGERYASYILGWMTIIGFAYSLTIEESLTVETTDLSIIGFTFAVFYLLYSMTDLDLNRPDSS